MILKYDITNLSRNRVKSERIIVQNHKQTLIRVDPFEIGIISYPFISHFRHPMKCRQLQHHEFSKKTILEKGCLAIMYGD